MLKLSQAFGLTAITDGELELRHLTFGTKPYKCLQVRLIVCQQLQNGGGAKL
jgi:hypothetical protein